jgi:hypothetical protein
MSTWRDAYSSDFQSLWALLLVPFAFLVYRLVRGAPDARGAQDALRREAAFIGVYSLGWTLETLLDPIVGGPLTRALGWSETFAGTVVMFVFVLLGDLRVFLLVFGLAGPGALPRALGFSLIVPVVTGVLYATVSWLVPDLPGQTLWLIYEIGFVAMAVWLARVWIPNKLGPERAALRSMLTSCIAFVAAYYALWATSDLVILLGVDEGWGLRMLPNQMYYALFVPFVYVRYFAMRER